MQGTEQTDGKAAPEENHAANLRHSTITIGSASIRRRQDNALAHTAALQRKKPPTVHGMRPTAPFRSGCHSRAQVRGTG